MKVLIILLCWVLAIGIMATTDADPGVSKRSAMIVGLVVGFSCAMIAMIVGLQR